ncbi:MAG: hypothetical protein ACRDRX_04440 [Pseudonocardiaceae bacterium]
MGALVAPGELAAYLQHPVRADTEEIAIRVAEGWLTSVTATIQPWPQPPPEDLWAWALELASIAYSNPQGLHQRTTDEDTREWSAGRREQILNAARSKYGGGSQPSGTDSFPPALCWPDPPRVPGMGT